MSTFFFFASHVWLVKVNKAVRCSSLYLNFMVEFARAQREREEGTDLDYVDQCLLSLVLLFLFKMPVAGSVFQLYGFMHRNPSATVYLLCSRIHCG